MTGIEWDCALRTREQALERECVLEGVWLGATCREKAWGVFLFE